MYKIWMHAHANIRKTKSVSVTLVLMFLIAALLLNIGLLVSINYGSFFDDLKQELSPSDVYYAIPDSIYTEKAEDYITENEHVRKTQINKALWVNADITSKDTEKSYTLLLQNMEEEREISKWKYIGEHLPAEDMSVYVPDIFKAVSGYELNDKITLDYTDETNGEKKSLTFTVKGYTEDIFFSSTDTGIIGFYLPEDTYKKVEDILDTPAYRVNLIHAQLDEVKNASVVEGGLRELLKLNSASFFSGDISSMIIAIDIELIELSRCMMATMVAAMMVLFALIVVAVCLLVVRFRIVNSIEDDMMKIGSLKAIGYTAKQIRFSLLLQYLLIAGFGSILGIVLSYPLLPAISMVFEQQSGLKWVQGFDGAISFTALLVILMIILLVVLLATRQVKKLSPISALRGETTARKFKRNWMQLEKVSGSIPVVLAIKSVVQNIKLNVMIAVILIAVTFAGSFGVIMYYNTTVDTKAFAEVPGMEITNVVATLNPEKELAEAEKTISEMPNVRKILYMDRVKLSVDDTEVSGDIMKDYSEKETRLVYEGHYPENSKEIVLAGILSERLGKTVGDTVTVRYDDHEETFTVSGLCNGSNMGGMNVNLLIEDYERLNPDFKPQTLNIYLEKGTDSAAFIKELQNKLSKEILLGTADFDKLLAEGMASYQNIVSIMGITMLVITVLVVTLVLYFMISSAVIRQKRQLGIQKAIGYTTFQLMNQLSITFTIPVAFGAILGSLLGAFITNPMMSATMKGMGIMKAGFIVDPLWVTCFGLGLIVFSYLLSLLTTGRIRKISAYALVTE